MIYLPRDRRFSFFLLAATMGFVLIGMLYFGLRLKGFRPGNNVHWSAEDGLTFNRFALVYTDGFFPASDGDSGRRGLTIEMAIRPEFSRYPDSIRFLLLVHAAEDRDQLVIGQWRSILIFMNGDDYANTHKTPKIYLQLDKYKRMTHLITIVSNGSGTKVFVDGRLAKKNQALVLKYPNNGEQARMVVGNNLSGKRSWIGTMLGLALYDRDLTDELIQEHYQQWHLNHDFGAVRQDAPRLLYAFDEGRGDKVKNKIGDGPDLIVPSRMIVLQKKILSWPRFTPLGMKSLAMDSIVNLIGFFPLGFLLTAMLVQFDGIGDRNAFLITVLSAFFFSLFIEIVQVRIPSRDSSLLDLILNTLGGAMGAQVFRLMRERSRLLGL